MRRRFPLPGRQAARGSLVGFGGLSVPPGADSFRSCGKNRKKGTPKGRALHKAALPFGIPSSVICGPRAPHALPCASPASGRAAQSLSMWKIAAGASPRPTGTGRISHWPVGNGLDRSAKKNGGNGGRVKTRPYKDEGTGVTRRGQAPALRKMSESTHRSVGADSISARGDARNFASVRRERS